MASHAISLPGDGLTQFLLTEVSVTGAVTLDSTAFGKNHSVTGASDYTITLPTPQLGKAIRFSFRHNTGILIRLTGDSMGGLSDRYYIAGESVTLRGNSATDYDVESESLRYPYFVATRGSDLSLTDETWTTATYSTETYDSHATYNAGTSVFTANRPGRWKILHFALLRATTINYAFAGVRVNTTTGTPALSWAGLAVTIGGASSSRIPFEHEAILAKGNTFMPAVYLDGVTGLVLDGVSAESRFEGRWIGHE